MEISLVCILYGLARRQDERLVRKERVHGSSARPVLESRRCETRMR